MSGHFPTDLGGHALVDLSFRHTRRVDFYVSGSLAVGSFREAGANSDLVAGIDALAFVRLGAVRVGAGLGYSYSQPVLEYPLAYDFGPTVLLGYELGDAAGWFTEARIRGFGNYFHDRAATQGVLLLSIGRRLSL